jgi:hypothetical protein
VRIEDYLPTRYLNQFIQMQDGDQISAQKLFEYDSDDFMDWSEEERAVNAMRVVIETRKRIERLKNA